MVYISHSIVVLLKNTTSHQILESNWSIGSWISSTKAIRWSTLKHLDHSADAMAFTTLASSLFLSLLSFLFSACAGRCNTSEVTSIWNKLSPWVTADRANGNGLYIGRRIKGEDWRASSKQVFILSTDITCIWRYSWWMSTHGSLDLRSKQLCLPVCVKLRL